MRTSLKVLVVALSFAAVAGAQSKTGSGTSDIRIRDFPKVKSLPGGRPIPAASSESSPPSGVQSVEKAQKLGLVRTIYQSSGRSSGDVITLTVRKLRGPERLILSLTPGLVLHNSLKTAQDMVIASLRGRDVGGRQYEPTQFVTLTSDQPVRYIVEAYCAEFKKENPRAGGPALRPDPEPDPVLACILPSARSKKLSVAATQAAVWIWTDRIDFDEMSTRMSISAADWLRAEKVAAACEAEFTH